jgi:hypothetical protein
MKGSLLFVLWLLQKFAFIASLDLPFGRRRHNVHRKSARPALVSSQFLKNSMRSSTADSKNDVKQQQNVQEQHNDEDIEALFRRHAHDETDAASVAAAAKNDWIYTNDEDIEVLFQEDEAQEKEEEDEQLDDEDEATQEEVTLENLDAMERTWRHCKKPLLRVGSKGMQFTHGNSLRQLLEAHQVVKVKVNTKRFGKCLIYMECDWNDDIVGNDEQLTRNGTTLLNHHRFVGKCL